MDSAKFISFSILIMLLVFSSATFLQGKNDQSDEVEDGFLKTDELLRKYKYPAETHFTITKDKYIIRLHRIARPGGRPILLQHGLLDSSAGYILMGPNISLGYYFYDLGYDVWLGNTRGNRYSRNHSELNPDNDDEFWDFGWHEIGFFDVPAMIDYILTHTNNNKLFYAGHSQGTTVLLVMLSERPEYNDKIILGHALAPIAFMRHVNNPFLIFNEVVTRALLVKPNTELLPHNDYIRLACLSTENALDTCIEMIFFFLGRDMNQMIKARFKTVFGHLPAGISMKQFLHYLQLIKSDRFRPFDYENDNLKIYGYDFPPDYNLSAITAPIALHYGLNDYLSAPIDVLRLSKLLPNLFTLHKIQLPYWNHMDYVYAKDVRKYLYAPMHLMNKKFWIEK